MPAFHDNRGITLIELLLSLMILVIVLAAAFAIHTLGQKAYERSIIQSNLQHDTVKIAGFITQSVRAAKEVEILGTDLNVPETIDDDNNYIYLYQAPASGIKTIVLKNKNGITPLVRNPAQMNNYTLLFAKEQAGSVLHYTINGVSSTQKYNLDTKVKLETLDSNGFVGVLNGGAVLRLKLKAGASFPLNITGNFIQDTVKLSGSGNRSIDQTDEKYTAWEFELFYTTLKNSLDNSDIEVANLPAGLSYSVVRKSSNILRITVNGTAEADIVNTLTPQVRILPTAVEAAIGQVVNASEFKAVKLLVSEPMTFPTYVVHENVFVYGTSLSVAGSTSITGEDSTIVIQENAGQIVTFNGNNTIIVKNAYIDDDVLMQNSTTLGKIGTTELIYVKQDVTVNNGGATMNANKVIIDGNVDMSNSGEINADTVYIKGNVTLDNGGAKINANTIFIDGNVTFNNSARIVANSAIYVKGSLDFNNWSALLKAPSYYIGGSIELRQTGNIIGNRIYNLESPPATPVFPVAEIAPLRLDAWYSEKGYATGGALVDGARIFSATDYSFAHVGTYMNVVIVSKGDITLTKNMSLSGVLYAPNGKITFGGGAFEGLAIARDGFEATNGGCEVIFKNMSNYIPDTNDYPF